VAREIGLGDMQLAILMFLHKEIRFVSPTDIGIQVGQFSGTGQLRDSFWSTPKCQGLHAKGLAERSHAGMYRINYTGVTWLRDHGHIK
jgi:hypothetical protein